MNGVRLPVHAAIRITSAIRRGSSWPVVVETAAGRFVTKLRGAAQGVAPLIAEIVVAELATALGLPVPDRAVVTIDEETPSDDANDELADLLARSRGQNLGFRFLEGAVDARADRLGPVSSEMAAQILWLDSLVMNPDRTPQNPNILFWHGAPWLIDHGASLPFQYDFGGVTEDAPRRPGFDLDNHLFAFAARLLRAIDARAAAALTRDVLRAALDTVPDDFLVTAFPDDNPVRIRAAYIAYVWKRLKAPRPFLPG